MALENTIKDKRKVNCFAYHKQIGKPCYALKKLYCKDEECCFYHEETAKFNIVNIEKATIEYEKNIEKKGISLR